MTSRKKRETNRAAWGPWLETLNEARMRSQEMGGAEKLEKVMHGRGKLDARQRIDALFDPDSFVELGSLVGIKADLPADGFVCGQGRIDGRPVLAGVEDFTIHAGAAGTGGANKRLRLAELAVQERLPVVWMIEGAGARMTQRKGSSGGSSRPLSRLDLSAKADVKGVAPVVCLVLGVSAGHSALAAPLSDFVVMTEQASMFTGGPPLVKAATGQEVTKEELGGPKVCAEIAGSVHNVVADDAAALKLTRAYLRYFPGRAGEAAPPRSGPEAAPRRVDELLEVIPPDSRQPYDVREVIEAIVDEGSWIEIQPGYGRTIATGLAFLGGSPVVIVANNPGYRAGALDSAGAIKAEEWIRTADAFGLPVIFLVDNPGVAAGPKAEREGILKWGGRMYLATRHLRSPKISVLMRKGFGFGLVTMAHATGDDQTLVLALPTASMAAMPAQSGGRTANLDDETRAKIEKAQRSGALGLANSLVVDDVVDPRDLRNALISGLEMSQQR